ncbi:alpha-galactosidase [Muribacter muris]|uniref:Alpha-galactosidase n=1 Tax=Muribacter muris TaxID=67855 RepID=A0A4Y9JV44_9PAST|nr:alpha-galactosidase [Muribacter muris]MBF0785702.1 alpha-galactosidase [Muribacter muris]MBF0827737.1 alpha-galactosidase [Muribacter muris]TFV08779.1 alpha-galactosidase [Muribacter muris]
MNNVIRLTSQKNDLVIIADQNPRIVYWGEHLVHFDPSNIAALDSGVTNGGLDIAVPVSLACENGRGYFESSSIEGHRNGQDWAPVFNHCEISQQSHRLQLRLVDELAGLEFSSEFELDEQTGVLKTRNRLRNLKAETFTVNRLAVTMPLPEYADEVCNFYGRWVREFQLNRHTLKHGGFIQENRVGRTSHEYPPNIMIGEQGFKEQSGQVWGFHLAWSGNHRIRADIDIRGRRTVQLEALYFPGEIQLAQHDEIATPWVYTTFSNQGLNAMSWQFHHYVRAHLVRFPRQKTRPVHLNIWEGVYFDHNPDHIIAMATEAAKMGVERFIIDDGWFIGRDDDFGGLGDWYLDERKYPHGLTPIIKAVKDLGMQFGIWVELEMINKNSQLYRQHPDWLLQVEGYDQPQERNQNVLDLCNPDVFNYLVERMDWLLGNHEIDYVKWDMNRRIVQGGHNGQAAVTKQTEAFYRLCDLLCEKYPDVEFEACASGGGRIDYEVLKRSQRFWASDDNDALERQTIQRGMSYFYPPEVMGAHIGGKHCHTTYRQLDVSFRGLTALFGHMGVELDPVKEGEAERQGFRKYIALHKQLRPLLHSGKVFRLDRQDPASLVNGVISQAGTQAVVLVNQLAMLDYLQQEPLRLPYLAEGNYEISLLDIPAAFQTGKCGHLMKTLPEWLTNAINDKPLVVHSDWLKKVGLTLPNLDPATAMLLHFKQC